MANLEAGKAFTTPPITPTPDRIINPPKRKPLPQILARTPLKATSRKTPPKMPAKRGPRGITKPTTTRARSCHTCRMGHNKCVSQGPGLPCFKCVKRKVAATCSLIDGGRKDLPHIPSTPIPPSTPPQTPVQPARAVTIADLIEAPSCPSTDTSATSRTTTHFNPGMELPSPQGSEGSCSLQMIATAALGYLSILNDISYEKRREQVSPSPREARPTAANGLFNGEGIYN